MPPEQSAWVCEICGNLRSFFWAGRDAYDGAEICVPAFGPAEMLREE